MAEMEVYADIWCPFAHAGLQWLFRQRRQLEREDLAIRVRSWPLELVNGAPLDPATTAEHVADLRAQVAADIFTKFDPTHFPKTSLPALSLAAAAYRRDQATGELVSLALRDALFEEGRDISRRDVLAGMASEYGVEYPNAEDEKTVLAEWHDGEARGVKGSPHFFCGDTDSFCPSLDISKDEEGHLHVRRNMMALTQFLTKCLEGSPRGAVPVVLSTDPRCSSATRHPRAEPRWPSRFAMSRWEGRVQSRVAERLAGRCGSPTPAVPLNGDGLDSDLAAFVTNLKAIRGASAK